MSPAQDDRQMPSQLPALEDPPGFITQVDLDKIAWDNGYRRVRLSPAPGGWLRYGSTTAPCDIFLAHALSGHWLLSVEHPGVARELGPSALSGPGACTLVFDTLYALHKAADRTYRLSMSLPDLPLAVFEQQTAALPRTTEAERLVIQRVGQDVFREALMKYWNGACPLTGITDPELLRASHIVPWAECETDALRLDVYNGLLLSSLWDAAFDAGLISFSDDGAPIASPALSPGAARALQLETSPVLTGLTPSHRFLLQRHRARHIEGNAREGNRRPPGLLNPR